VLTGDSAAVLTELGAQYELGVAPDMAVEAMLETVHAIARIQAGAEPDLVMSQEGRAQLGEWAERLSPAMLHRFWQLLLKGLEEVKRGTMALQAAEMALLRLVHAAGLPDPGKLIRALETAGPTTEVPLVHADPPLAAEREPVRARQVEFHTQPPRVPVPDDAGAPPDARLPTPPTDFEGVRAFAERYPLPRVEAWLHDDVGAVRMTSGELVLAGREDREMLTRLRTAWRETFGVDLAVSFDERANVPTLRAQKAAAKQAERQTVLDDPNVRAVVAAFPDAELIGYELPDGTIYEKTGTDA
ncbi:MAG: DNA polymerase III subunit gamma/tau, partial [Pacificimonas sp.]